jgi:hypothetical protein
MASFPCPACGIAVEPEADGDASPDACRQCGQPLRIDYRYRLTQHLGGSADGASAIYGAVAEPLGTTVAVLVCGVGGRARDAFVDGYQRFARFRHRSIASIRSIDEGSAANRRPAIIVIEWLAGGLLRQRVEQGGRLGAPEVGELLHGLLGALNLASTSLPPIAHGAITPDTIGYRGDGPVPVLFAFERGHAISLASAEAAAAQVADANAAPNATMTPATGPHPDVLQDLAAVGRVAAWAATQNEWADPATLTAALDGRLATIIDGLRKAPQREGYRSASAALGDLQAHVHPPTSGGGAHRPAHSLTHDEEALAGYDPFAREHAPARGGGRSRGGAAGSAPVQGATRAAVDDEAAQRQRRAAQSSETTTSSSAFGGTPRRSGRQPMPVAAPKDAAGAAKILRRLFIGGIALFFLAPVCVQIAAEVAEDLEGPDKESAKASARPEAPIVAAEPTPAPSAVDPAIAPSPSADPPPPPATVHELPPFVQLIDADVDFPLLRRVSGKVESITGTIPHGTTLAAGDRCTLEIRQPAESSELSCRVFLACGRPLLTYYGAGTAGYMACLREDGMPIRATDDADNDGDPAFTFDLTAGTAEVSATLPTPWSVKVALKGSR